MRKSKFILPIAIFVFAVIIFSFSSRAAVEENDWRLESIDCKTFEPTEIFIGLVEVDICYNLTNLKNENRNFNQTLKFYPENPDSTDLKTFAKWGNVPYNTTVLDYGNVSYNQTYFNIINQTNTTHYTVQEVANNTTTLQKYCDEASLTAEWCQWYSWEATGNHEEENWKFDWDYYPNSQFEKIGNDFFKINELQIPANGNIIFKLHWIKQNGNLFNQNDWKLDITVTDGTLNATLDPVWPNPDWQNHYSIIIQSNNSSHMNEPIILNVSDVGCAFNNKKDLIVVFNNTTEVPFQYSVDYEEIVFIANITNPQYSTYNNYSIYCNNSAANWKNVTDLFWVAETGNNQSVSHWTPIGALSSYAKGATARWSKEKYSEEFNATAGYYDDALRVLGVSDKDYWISFHVTPNKTVHGKHQYVQLIGPSPAYLTIAWLDWDYTVNGQMGWGREAGLNLQSYKLGDWETINMHFKKTPTKFDVNIAAPTNVSSNTSLPVNANVTLAYFTNVDAQGKERRFFDDIFISTSEIQLYPYVSNASLGLLSVSVPPNTPPNITQPNIIPSVAYANDTLNCSATPTDNEQTDLTVLFTWYQNNVPADFNATVQTTNNTLNYTNVGVTGLTKGNSWICSARAFDGELYSDWRNSSEVTILNSPPDHSKPNLVSTSGNNFNTDNLTCYNKSTYDVDNNVVTNIYNWFINSISLEVLNLPFESSARDYTPYENNGTIYNATFVNGTVGNALSFDGDDYVFISDSNSLALTSKGTWELWFKRVSIDAEQILFDKTKISGEPNYRLKLLSNNTLEFSFLSTGAPAQDQTWITNTQAEFELGTFNETRWDGSGVSLNETTVEQQIFFDGFESGDFATNGWVVSGPGDPWEVSNVAPYQGTYHTRALKPGAGTETRLAVNLSTVNFTNISIFFYRQMVGLDAADDFSVDYFDGATYINLVSLDGNDASYQLMDISLPENASNNPNFGIRFRCTAGAVSEECRVDNVEVRGLNSAFVNEGTYDSKVFDAGQNLQWNNLSWNWNSVQNLPFQVRSCDDTNCDGEIFVGPDNTSNTFYNTSAFNNISNIPTNRYAQFKAHFLTANISQTPTLYEVRIGYTIPEVPSGLVNITSTTQITDTTNFHHVAVTYDNSLTTDNLKIYFDGVLENQKTETRPASFLNNDLYIGKRFPENDSYFNGVIDEFRIYNRALSAAQIQANSETLYNTTVSDETRGGEVYKCEVTPNDGELDGLTLASGDLTVLWEIMFNVTSGEQGNPEKNDVIISCNLTGFDQGGDSTNPYGPFGFSPGSYSCNFTRSGFFIKTQNFIADTDKTINVLLSEAGGLTFEEHEWLEAIYNCIVLGDCSDLSILTNINQTVTNIWREVRPSDKSVILEEIVNSNILSSTSNITVTYNISIPSKAGYNPGDLLPIRVSYWFVNNTTGTPVCYNQGDLPSGVEIDPFCAPLIAQTLGPMEGTVTFTVNLKPSLPDGTYDFIGRVDIDPRGQWINYGQKKLGTVTVLETTVDPFIDLTKIAESLPEITLLSEEPKVEQEKEITAPEVQAPQVSAPSQPVQVQDQEQPSIATGLLTATKDALSERGIIIIAGMIVALLALVVVSRMMVELKKQR